MMARPLAEFLFLLSGENALVVLLSETECLMNEGSGRDEHRFACQRTCHEGSKVALKHIHDVVDEFLG